MDVLLFYCEVVPVRVVLKACGAWTALMAGLFFVFSLAPSSGEGDSDLGLIMASVMTVVLVAPIFLSGWYTYRKNSVDESPTERQRGYADRLGVSYSQSTTKDELSKLIELAVLSEPASERQREYAKDLGIEFPDSITKMELSSKIDRAVRERKNNQL